MATKKRAPRAEPSQATADALRDFVVEKAAEKLEHSLNAKVTKAARQQEKVARQQQRSSRQQERLSQKAARAAEHLDRLSAHLEMLELWTRTEPTGRQPRFTRDQIAAAAIRIADAEGAEALSMRRIAAELDAGTMTLYHYIRTKDELLSLVGDAIMGELVLGPDQPMPTDWREAVTLIARRTLAVFQRHPWIIEITDDPTIGPNGVRHFDETLQAVASLDVDLATKLDIVGAVDEYVFGYCLNQRNNAQDSPVLDRTMAAYFESLIETGEYPAMKALAEEIGIEESWSVVERHLRDDSRFERTLARLLDGFEAALRRDGVIDG